MRSEKVKKESLPFLVALIVALGLLTFVPLLSTFLPDFYTAGGP